MNQTIWAYLWTVGYVLFALYAVNIPGLRNPKFTTTGLIVVGLVYVLPNLLFGVTLDIVNNGIRIKRHSTKTIPFQEIERTFGLFLFPLQLIVVRTKLGFPNSLLISADEVRPHSRFSFLRDGVKVAELRSRLLQINRA